MHEHKRGKLKSGSEDKGAGQDEALAIELFDYGKARNRRQASQAGTRIFRRRLAGWPAPRRASYGRAPRDARQPPQGASAALSCRPARRQAAMYVSSNTSRCAWLPPSRASSGKAAPSASAAAS